MSRQTLRHDTKTKKRYWQATTSRLPRGRELFRAVAATKPNSADEIGKIRNSHGLTLTRRPLDSFATGNLSRLRHHYVQYQYQWSIKIANSSRYFGITAAGVVVAMAAAGPGRCKRFLVLVASREDKDARDGTSGRET
ncbi:hypothetical protein NOR_08510 [Metarhizium rileyi]|uniref:Uncharacterized protein n=1 Tax=Metarhizium rileyi (strain RCEF 4871) TaxID=1649241 RepID=A0A166W5D1_METRR|nr:hypothetical protein NOR_08510 [Metarhizium rileyi RCEF 4871]